LAGIKGKSGRQHELTPGVSNAIILGVRSGLPQSRAAEAAGFSPAAVTKWKHNGDRDLEAGKDSVFAKFVKGLIKADVDFEQVRLANVVAASRSTKTWQASAWLLERKFTHWRKITQLATDPNNPLRLSVTEGLAERVKAARSRLLKRAK
jgi:hypothetical protein